MILHQSLRLLAFMLLSISCRKEVKLPEAAPLDYWKDYVPFEAEYNAGGLQFSVQYTIKPEAIDTVLWIKEFSGMSASLKNPGYAWVHNDSGNDPFLYLMRLSDGALVWSVYAGNWKNRDWEDVEVVKTAQGAYVYLGDFGDNQQSRTSIHLYRIDEPVYGDSLFQDTTKIADAEDIELVFPDKAHDVEALFSDAQRGDVYLVTKRESRSMLFGLPYKQSFSETDTLVYCGSFPFNYTTAASASLDGKSIAMRNYQQIMEWTIVPGVDFRDQLSQEPKQLPYDNLEIQGESIALTDSGYYLLSEAAFGFKPVLYFFRKE
ncbi:MAG: hypothetical protein EP332_00365 [Bacteroidetes bacterium]|nr:MAG: hypothetical protein EP332_00365 [Bacteroidota bacterium]